MGCGLQTLLGGAQAPRAVAAPDATRRTTSTESRSTDACYQTAVDRSSIGPWATRRLPNHDNALQRQTQIESPVGHSADTVFGDRSRKSTETRVYELPTVNRIFGGRF